MAALLRTSPPNLGLRIRSLAAWTRTQPGSGFRFASSLDTPIRTTTPRPARRSPSSASSAPRAPRKGFVSAFVGGSTIDDATPVLSETPAPSRKHDPPRKSRPTRSGSYTTSFRLSPDHLLVTKDFAEFVRKKERTPAQVMEHVMEVRNQRDRDFMLARILNEYLKQNRVHNIEPLIIEVRR